MSNQTTELDGSVDMLARAMRDVFVDAMTKTGNDIKTEIRTDMEAMENRINDKFEKVGKSIAITNKNMQAQFAQQEEKIAEIGRKIDNVA